MDGAKTRHLTVKAQANRNGYQYRCVVTSGTNSLTSAAATLTVSTFAITEDPADVTADENQTVTFTVTATGDNLKYQWQVKTLTADWANTGMDGAKTRQLTVKAQANRNGYQYRCIVTSGTNSLTSAAATLTVSIIDGDFEYALIENSTTNVRVVAYNGNASTVTVPTKIKNDQYTVKEIGAEAFMGNTTMTSISLPNGIKLIGERAFKNCTNLSSMSCHN